MRVVLLNIRHGGGRRTQRLLEWLTTHSPDVVVLPEWRNNSSGGVIRNALWARGLQVATATVSNKSNGVLLAARRPFRFRCATSASAITGAMIVANFGSEGQMLAAYFPQGKSKLPFFKRCIGEAEASYNIPFVLLGDLNTGSNGADVEGKGARFIYADEFEELQTKVGLVDLWRFEHGDRKEWTWRSRINGFRVDHALANAIFRKRNPKIRCFYDHTPRETATTDHSALVLTTSQADFGVTPP